MNDLRSELFFRKNYKMNYDSSDDEVFRLCRELGMVDEEITQLGIRKRTKKKKNNVFNNENLDINNLPIEIISENGNSINIVDEDESTHHQIIEEISEIHTTDNNNNNYNLSDDRAISYIFTENSGSSIVPENTQPIECESISVIENEVLLQTNDENEEHGDMNEHRKRRSKGCSDEKEWSKNRSKKLRMEGEEYLGYSRDSKGPKFKVLHDTMRPAREIGPRCISDFCKKSKLRYCANITEEERKSLFHNYWKNMSWEQRKQYIISHVELCPKKQVKSEGSSRRSESRQYFLTISSGRVQVCMHTFLNTFGIKEWTVRYWLSTSELGMAKKPELTHKILEGHSKKEDIAFLKDFFDHLPKMPSHYCRASTTRRYLEPIIENKNHLYIIYIRKCTDENRQPVSRWSFDRIFAEQNLSLFQPKKDQCDTCCAYKAGNLNEDDYKRHITLKDAAREEKAKDKVRALAEDIHLFTHDLQSVKLCPYLKASALYYKTKLCVHNFTMYNMATRDVYCYWFDESNAGLVASVFVSCIIHCLKVALEKKPIPVTLFSDGCTAQNRNAILSNALLELAMEYKTVITQKFLEKGHTQMECDSSHSAIECKIKNREIYLPSQYASICKEVRPKQPFIVNFLQYDFFDDYSNKNEFLYESIRPGRMARDPTVTDLRALEYCPNGVIRYKLNFADEYKELPRRCRTKQVRQGPRPKLYGGHLKITESKWKHLQDLKSVMPSDCYSFYDSLLH